MDARKIFLHREMRVKQAIAASVTPPIDPIQIPRYPDPWGGLDPPDWPDILPQHVLQVKSVRHPLVDRFDDVLEDEEGAHRIMWSRMPDFHPFLPPPTGQIFRLSKAL